MKIQEFYSCLDYDFNSLIVETGSHYATLTDLELTMSARPASQRDLLSLTPKLRDERGILTSPETMIAFLMAFSNHTKEMLLYSYFSESFIK